MLQSRLLPDKFDGDAAMQPDDWLQTVALYKEACGLSDAQLFLEMPRFLAKEPKKVVFSYAATSVILGSVL